MVTPADAMQSCRAWPWWQRVVTGLSVLGLALSGYLSWHYLAGGTVLGCGGGSPCDEVLHSRWSAIGGVLPVSGLAAGAYLAMLVASFSLGPATAVPVRRLAWSAMLILVGAAAGSALWFTVVQIRILGSFCPYCMATHLTGLLLAALVVWRAPRQFDAADSTDDDSASDARLPRSVLRRRPFFLIGLGVAALLVAAQIGLVPPGAHREGTSSVVLHAVDPHAAPLVGSPDARHVVALLFDYQCPHCQKLHLLLDEAIRRYHGELAFALCPAPLNSRCNPYVPRDVNEFRDSCELARVALAVWVADRAVFPVFDQWMFSFESGDRWRPRSLDAARARAIALVGPAKFAAAWTDAWSDHYMAASVQLYGETMQAGSGVPKLVFGSRWVTPEPTSADDLMSILQGSLGVPAP